MIQVLLVIHLIIAIALILVILVQKSEGAAGGGLSATASVSTMMQPRARPSPITRITTVLGITFFGTSLFLAILAKPDVAPSSIFTPTVDGPAVPSVENSVAPPAPTTAPSESQPAAVPPATPAVPNN